MSKYGDILVIVDIKWILVNYLINAIIMDVINKLYSSVSSTVSQLSGVLPGNPVTREFEAIEHIASAGPGLQWKIYRGYKKSTKQEASIFVFEKKQLDRWSRDDREMMMEILKRGITQLTKIRHPQILTVQHPLEESRESLAFATEPVFASLANILGSKTNMPQPAPIGIANYKLYEIEIKYGLQQICEGLSFLHSDVKLLHRNICPESIIINQLGAWKIFGFDFCVLNQNTQDSQPFWPFVEYNITWHHLNQPKLDFLAPEFFLIKSFCPASDIYSLGMVIYCLHGPAGKPLKSFESFEQYKTFAKELKNGKSLNLSCVVDGLREYVKLMLHHTPEMRPDLHQLTKIPYFEDVGVKTLSYLDSLFQWDNLQKSKFYKGLPQIIQKLPHRICIYRILPCLIKEFVNPTMVPFVLPNVLLISENCTKEQYTKHILKHLRPVMKIQDPIQILLIFMQKMELLLKLSSPEDVKNDVLPMLYRALDSDAQQIQELCLSVLPTFSGLIDYSAMKNALLPRIKKLCLNTQVVSVRVNCLLCLGKLLDHLDKWLVLDEVLPFLPMIQSKEPAVLMGILGIYKLALTHSKLGITKELMANKIIPFLVPLCIENGLTLNQFDALLSVVKDMMCRVETEHRGKLKQLNSIQQEHKSLDMNLSQSTGPLVPSVPTPMSEMSEMDKMFSNLGLENYINNSPTHTMNTNSDTMKSNTNSLLIAESKGLTLEDKQRIVTQQETAQKLQSQPKLTPKITSAPNTQKQNPVSNLMQSNLNQMMLQTNTTAKNTNLSQNIGQPNYNPTNWNANTRFANGNPNFGNSNLQIGSTNTNLQIGNANAGIGNSSSNFGNSNPNFGNTNLNFGNSQQFGNTNMSNSMSLNNMNGFTNKSTNQWTSNNPNLTNWNSTNQNSTAFDSLLSTGDNKNNKVPMNQMANNIKQPLLSSNSVNNQTSKGLTKEDIYDLLS